MKSKIDYKEVIKLIDLLDERNLSHFELEVEGFKIRISRDTSHSVKRENETAASRMGEFDTALPKDSPETALPENESGLHIVTSPMVGTFYRASDPSSAPFIEQGDQVKKNQTLCIIEAMKLMNEIESEVEGVLEQIYIKNGKPVEYGQKLFAIKPLS